MRRPTPGQHPGRGSQNRVAPPPTYTPVAPSHRPPSRSGTTGVSARLCVSRSDVPVGLVVGEDEERVTAPLHIKTATPGTRTQPRTRLRASPSVHLAAAYSPTSCRPGVAFRIKRGFHLQRAPWFAMEGLLSPGGPAWSRTRRKGLSGRPDLPNPVPFVASESPVCNTTGPCEGLTSFYGSHGHLCRGTPPPIQSIDPSEPG